MPQSEDADLVRDLQRLVQRLNEMPDDRDAALTPIGLKVRDYLGVDPAGLPLLREDLPPHRLVDADIALDALAARDKSAVIVGIGGGQERQHEDLAGLLVHRFTQFREGQIEYATAATGPSSTRQTVSFGLRMLHFGGVAVVVLQRAANRMFGRESASLEVLCSDATVASEFMTELQQLMIELSVVRGNVVGFAPSEYGQGIGHMTFLPRPDVAASEVILSPGLLDDIRGHVVDIGAHAGRLRSLHQHLKRGVLLYGPPGTGKTLTVRHLLAATPGTTAVVLQGGSLAYVGEAARLARALSPAIVVLEDVDLVAMERGMFGGPQPLLFEILDAMDGVEGDTDIAFILTTNRADVLEPALAARPGRVDLAVEIPLPDATARRALFRLYGASVPLSGEVLDAAADRAEGVTASFAKELIRRTVLHATVRGSDVVDSDLTEALDAMLAAQVGISRVLFGGDGSESELDAPGHITFGY
ncbi:ATP-dependent 26S proteasome regulatory subunit [Microbacterium halimionae]|uniref:ATP-dependent 26S proteasome regulatory subunit n=1 Tax=Microbacterium halimionae TaxID=1526413 RepID=A0A7W3JR72_9MICO|nr:ATP-binding protein [Microbacterium halimionae]MBA8817507.1 ATP-dependent 26S proteasome regulatory subunit [Microbacterium halimionae]NII95050.1 ATP-dependent 26S proteasome regulatory subunit [Microbacterium halimionae]